MARAGSINYQVSNIIKKHNGIGRSKLESRNSSGLKAENNHNVSDLYHSYKSLDNVRSELTNLGKFVKENHQLKDMSKIDINIIKDWINSKSITYNTASNYLSNLNKISEHFLFNKEQIKELRSELKQTLEIRNLKNNNLKIRAYKNLDKVQINKRSEIAFELQRDYGLRVKEATHINLNRQLKENTLIITQKGGKLSEININPILTAKIKENAINGRYEVNYKTYSRDLKEAVEKVNNKFNGTHGIRHTYAQTQLANKSKAEVSKALGHTREEIINTYLR